jgi:hypothetical protein
MADVVPLTKKRKVPQRRRVTVCWGGWGVKETTAHIAVGAKGCSIDAEAGLLVIDSGDDDFAFYPIGSVFYWIERDDAGEVG